MQNNIGDMDKEQATPFISFEKAWAGLKPELDAEAARREKRKRRILFFWFTSIVIALGIGVYVFENNKNKENLAMQQKQVILKNEGTANTNNNKKIAFNKEINVKPDSKIQSNNSSENRIELETKNSANAIIQTQKIKSVQQNTSVLKNKIAAVSSNKNNAVNEDNTVARFSAKSNSAKAKINTNKSNVSSLIKVKTIQEKNKESIAKIGANTIDKSEMIADQNGTSNSIIEAVKSIDSTKKIVDTTVAKLSIANTSNNKTKKVEEKKVNAIHYGLQWNLPTQNGVNFLNVNSVNQPATLLIPQLFVSKQIGKKHSLLLAFNPYAQYYLNNKAVVDFAKYDVVIYSASQSNTTKPEKIIYTEATAFNKLISVEASLLYQYQISSKMKIGFGLSNSWTQAALMQNKVVKNASLITRDSLYGIDKTDKDWSHLQTSFLLGKLEVLYNIKKLDIGVCFSKPISSPFDNSQYKTPINTNLFVRWMIK